VAKTELRVFVASPGGLDDERDAVENAANQLNSRLGDKLNVVITVRRFEQLVSRAGRPQGQINSWVDDCDVLIAIVYRQMGSASGHGDATGFTEEFDRAIARFEETGRPTISLHFKGVDKDSESDAGPKLAAVLDFRDRIEKQHLGLYQRFKSVDQFSTSVLQLLVEEMFEVASALGDDSTASASDSAPHSLPVASEIASQDDAQSGLAQVLDAFAHAVRNSGPVSELDVDRLALFSTAVAKESSIPGTHLANRLYLRPNADNLSAWESEAWFRAYVADHGRGTEGAGRVVPFARVAGRSAIEARLLHRGEALLVSDLGDLRRGYLKLLAAYGLRPDLLWDSEDDIERWAQLAQVGNSVDVVSYWASACVADDTKTAQQLARSDISAVAELGEALRPLVDDEYSIDGLLHLDARLIVKPQVLERCGPDLLKRASSNALLAVAKREYLDRDVHVAVIREIARRHAWTPELVAKVFAGGQLLEILEGPWKSEARRLLFESNDSATVSLVIKALAAKDGDSKLQNFAHYAAVNSDVRAVLLEVVNHDSESSGLDVHFALNAFDPSFRDQALSLVAGTYEPANERLKVLSEQGAAADIIDFTRERDVVIALAYLARSQATLPRGALDEIRSRARSSKLFRYQMLEALERVASDSDIPLLLDGSSLLLRDEPERLSALFARATLARLRGLLTHGDARAVLASLDELGRRDRPPPKGRLEELLRHDDARVRMKALGLLAPRISDPAGYIREYVRAERAYFYNVVSELDRWAADAPEVL